MAEDAEGILERPVFSVGARGELKTRDGSLSSEGSNAAVQARRSTRIKVLRSLEYSNAPISIAITVLNFFFGVHLHFKHYIRTVHGLNFHQYTATFRDLRIQILKCNYTHRYFSRPHLLAPHTSGLRDVPRCGALSLLQKPLNYRGDPAETAVRLNVKLWTSVAGDG
jgi:hypothetical protein